MTVAGIVLAAGDGSRLGGHAKALLPHRGRPLLHTVVDALLEGGCDEVFVVTGAFGDDVATACPAGTTAVHNPAWPEGMSTSFECGVGAAQAFDRVALTVVDFPGITAELVRFLLTEHETGTVTQPLFEGRPGHPVVFDLADAVAAADEATGDEGARSFLARNRDRVRRVECSSFGDAGDIDTPDDLGRLAPAPID